MRLLFEIGPSDCDTNGTAIVRDSARCITVKDGRVAMVHSLKYNYYKFPDGGIEAGESREEALAREALEEAGLVIIPESIKEYGRVRRVDKLNWLDADLFIQDNYYYLCEAEDELKPQNLDDYEADERFTFKWVEPDTAIEANRLPDHGPKSQFGIEREARVLEIMKEENIV